MTRRTMLPWLLALTVACATEEAAKKPTGTPAAPAKPDAKADAQATPPAEVKLPGEEVLAQQPQPPPLAPFEAPVPAVKQLPNGLRVYSLHRPESAIQAIRLVVKRGAAADPEKLPGLASLTAEMLEAGSAGKGQADVARAADALGATLTVGAGYDATMVAISGQATQLGAMTQLLADVALRPNFDPAEWKKLQAQRTAELAAERAEPTVAAELAFRAAIYGAHPLGRRASGTPDSVKAMTLDQVKAFFKAYSPKEAAIVSVGGAPPEQVLAALEAAFGGWKPPKSAGKLAVKVDPPKERPRLVMVDFPGKPQSVLRIGLPAVPRSSPDYLALNVANTVLGGSFTSRLMQNLREKNGYTYGAGSRFEFGAGPGPFSVRTSVKTDVTGEALREALGEVEALVQQPLAEQELAKGKALLASHLVSALETSEAAASAIAELFVYDLPLDEHRTFVQRLNALDVKAVQQALQRVVTPEAMTITIVGDVGKVQPLLAKEAKLASLPAPERRDAEGRKLK